MYREYRYRKLFQVSHEDYLDEPAHLIDWMIQIDGLVGGLGE